MDVQHFPGRQPGYSLIEVMVALLVLSIGMLGIAGLFITTLKDTRTAFNRTRAVSFAWDMAERIRANSGGGEAYEADENATGENGSCFATEMLENPDACTVEVLAAHDIFQWKSELTDAESGLPEGKGSIDRDDATVPATYTITVEWTEGFTASGEDAVHSVTVVTQL